jgi:hypothetical protein
VSVLVSADSHKKLTLYSLNLVQKINQGSIFFNAKTDIANAAPEPDDYKDLEFVDVESSALSGGRDDPHVKTAMDNDDVPRYETQGFVFAAFNHYIDIRKGPGLFDDYDGYSYKKGSASKNEYQDATDAKKDWKVAFLSFFSGHKKVDDGIAYWLNDEYVHAPGMQWYRGCSPSIERYSFPNDKKIFSTIEAEAASRFPLADSTGKTDKGIPYSVFMPLDNMARYWYTIFLYANPGKMHLPALIAPVLHAIQDAIVPHHAAGCNGNWHNRWENDFNANLYGWLRENEFEKDVRALYEHWRQNKIPAPTPLKPGDWKQAPSPNWTINQLVTWVALNAYREYEHNYNQFKNGYKADPDCGKRMARIATAMALLIYEKAILDTASRLLVPLNGNREALGRVVFRAFNYPSHYIVSENGIGKIAETTTPHQQTTALFRMTFGLADGTCISFESVEKPGYFLRHSNFALRLDPYQNTSLFKKDATFKPMPGLADKMCLSFMSTNFRNYYIRHRNFNLYLDDISKTDPATAFVFRKDATFMPLLR